MISILFLAYAVQVLAKPIKFYTITDNDRQTEYSYLTYNELIDGREIKILKNVSVKPNELSSLKYIDDELFTTDDNTGVTIQYKR
jgi:predicted MPP superfamily phosphohydrolase